MEQYLNMPSEFAFLFGMFGGGILLAIARVTYLFIRTQKTGLTRHYSSKKKLVVMSFPVFGALAVLWAGEPKLFLIFIVASIVGPILEFLLGEAFYRYYGIKIWNYNVGTLGKFTSIVAAPYWGAVAIWSVFLARRLGI